MSEEQAVQSEQATEQTTETTQDVSRETSEQPEVLAERPEFVPEKFWNEETGEVKLEEAMHSYNNAEQLISGKEEAWEERIKAKLDLQAKESMPESPDKYELPELLDGINEEMVEANPITESFRKFAHENNLSNDQFKSVVNMYLDKLVYPQQKAFEEESKKLGDNGAERLDAVNNFVSSRFTPEETQLIQYTLGTTALGVDILEKFQDMTKSNRVMADSVVKPQAPLTLAKVREKMKDPRYYDPRHKDPAFVEEVDADFARLYGE